MIDPADSRQTSAVVEPSAACASTRPTRSATKLEPTSRTPCRAMAATAKASPTSLHSTSGHRLSSAKGREFSAHPNGESHVSQELSMR